jgi:hypothetical protein
MLLACIIYVQLHIAVMFQARVAQACSTLRNCVCTGPGSTRKCTQVSTDTNLRSLFLPARVVVCTTMIAEMTDHAADLLRHKALELYAFLRVLAERQIAYT